MTRPPTGAVIERRGKNGVAFGLRFTAYGKRRFVTLSGDGWNRAHARRRSSKTSSQTSVLRRRRRLKASKPKRTWLELVEVQALLAAAGKHRALIATMILADLRVGELTALRWRCVDLAAGKLRIADAKTDAGERVVDVSPWLLDELKLHRADSRFTGPGELVFPTGRCTIRNRSKITRQILQPAIERANIELAEAGRSPIGSATNHSPRRTFCASYSRRAPRRRT